MQAGRSTYKAYTSLTEMILIDSELSIGILRENAFYIYAITVWPYLNFNHNIDITLCLKTQHAHSVLKVVTLCKNTFYIFAIFVLQYLLF